MFRSFRVYRCAAAASTSSTAPVHTTTSDSPTSDSSKTKTIIHGDKIGNRFAEKPQKSTPRWVLNEAAQKHKGWGVYQNRKQVIEVLQAVRVSKPEWWCSACDDVLARMINLRQTMNWGATSQERGAIIVIEGLDGVGKTTVTQALASEKAIENDILASQEEALGGGGDNNDGDESYVPSSRNLIGSTNSFFSDSRQNDYVGQNHAESRMNFTPSSKNKKKKVLSEQEEEHNAKEKLIQTVIPGALLMRTPDPCLDTARAKFRVMEEPVARAFYCAANYITADAVIRYTHEGRVVVLDRWWNSTCAMALASRSLALAQMTIKEEQKNLEKMMARKEARLQQLEEAESSSDAADSKSPAAQAMKIAKSILFPPSSSQQENDSSSSSSTSDYFSSSSSSKKERAPSSIWSRYFGQESLKQKEISKMEEMEMTRDLIMNPPERLERQLMMDLLPEEKNKIYSWPSDLPPVDLRILLDVDEDIRKKRMAKRGDENQEEKVLAEKKALRDTAMEAYRRMTPELKIVQVPNWASAVNEIVDEIEKSSELRKLMPRGMPKKYSQDFVDTIKPY